MDRYFLRNPVPMCELNLRGMPNTDAQVIHTNADAGCEPLGSHALVRANLALCRLLGARNEAELRHGFARIFNESSVTALADAVRALRSGAEESVADTYLRRLDGPTIRVRIHMQLPDESLQSVLVSVNDISTDSDLREQLNLLSALPEANPNITALMDCGGFVLYANPAARLWLGSTGFRRLDELRNLLPDDFGQTYCERCDHSHTRTAYTTYQDQRFHCQITPVVGTRRCMITLTDITEIERLRLERELYFEAFRATSNPMVITDEHGRIEHVNGAFERLYGYSQDEAVGRTPSILNPGPEAYRDIGIDAHEYRAKFTDLWTQLRTTGSYQGELLNRCKSGVLTRVQLTISRLAQPQDGALKYLGLIVDVDEIQRREQSVRMEIFSTISMIGELRDHETGHHMRRVGLYARIIAEALGFPRSFRDDMERFAPLHDIGKVGVSDTILRAPRRLTKEEFAEMTRHTTLGHGLLAGKPTMEAAAEIALSHHERFDGTGYPHGLQGERIPVAARIVALADVYDALRSMRPYKAAWSHGESVAEIERLSGRQFDPDVVQAFLQRQEQFESVAEELADGQGLS